MKKIILLTFLCLSSLMATSEDFSNEKLIEAFSNGSSFNSVVLIEDGKEEFFPIVAKDNIFTIGDGKTFTKDSLLIIMGDIKSAEYMLENHKFALKETIMGNMHYLEYKGDDYILAIDTIAKDKNLAIVYMKPDMKNNVVSM